MNALVRDHLAATYFAEYQLLRRELMDVLRDEDLAFRPAAAAASLGELCREIGDIERSYVEAFKTFRQDFAWRNPDPDVEHRVAALSTWYADLDRELLAAVEALTDDDVANRRISRYDFDVEDFSPLAAQELDIYREALLIFYAKVSVYLRIWVESSRDIGAPGSGEVAPWSTDRADRRRFTAATGDDRTGQERSRSWGITLIPEAARCRRSTRARVARRRRRPGSDLRTGRADRRVLPNVECRLTAARDVPTRAYPLVR